MPLQRLAAQTLKDCLVRIMSTILNYTEKISAIICRLILLTMLVLALLQVLFRYVFLAPISWAEEVMRYLMVWLALLGSSIGIKRARHVMFSFVVDKSPQGLRYIMALFSRIIMITFFVFVLILGWKLALSMKRQTFISLDVSMIWIFIAFPVFSLLSILYIIEDLFVLIKLRKIGPESTEMVRGEIE